MASTVGRFGEKLLACGHKLTRAAYVAVTWPFAEPKMSVLFATFAGILLSTGMTFLLSLFEEDKIRPLRLSHLAGAIFMVASILVTIVTWSMQFFADHLQQRGKGSASVKEKVDQFEHWGGSRWTRAVAVMALVLFLGAMFVLALAAGNGRKGKHFEVGWF